MICDPNASWLYGEDGGIPGRLGMQTQSILIISRA
uniref:Uncharacterized protein n=1 Tax=Utricularia reniformis TaxID=192314 RepID=A0A1Y0B3X5_9LAMI|nr:hypothetical protein AEK19_MT1929 [Utricularia reniformis]ART32094.1 hypothetical protein AEK19_MT1929 [Utricularia reniformis]